MGKRSLGIDISDGQVTGVALEQQGKLLAVTACLSLPLSEAADVAPQIIQLCQQFAWREDPCVCGLPLSLLSVRNLALPFSDVKQIAQALPFELEEQLIVPVESLVVDFMVSATANAGSRIIAFAVEKFFLQNLLEGLAGVVDPEIITPAVTPLAAQVVRQHRDVGNVLMLHADLHSMTMVLAHGERPLFYRRLSYPDQMILHPPFLYDNDQLVVVDMAAAKHCIRLICASIERSLDYYRLESEAESRPERVVLTGPLAGMDAMAGIIASTLQLPVDLVDLLAANAIDCPEAIRTEWQSQRFDRAVSLALLGFGKKAAINFRKETFVKKRTFYSSRKQLIGAAAAVLVLVLCFLGYLWSDCRLLQRRDQIVRDEMVAIFKQTFPKITKVREPYTEMQAALKAVQGPESPAPLFVSDKRVLGLLADISSRIPETVALRVSRLAIDRESVLIKGTTSTFNSVDTIKNALAVSPKYKGVQIVSATADKAKNSSLIRFEIQLQLEGI
ncbi:MAG: PilN domain-containing protein [Desulfobulbaceae bacterium]|nr:PilN domain-containing protein [Desulfobulbaceae bacterium]